MAKKNKKNNNSNGGKKNDGGLFGLLGLLSEGSDTPDLSFLGNMLSEDEKKEFVDFVRQLDDEEDPGDDFGVDDLLGMDIENINLDDFDLDDED